ncbi:hypothetical protein CHS0354_011228 [Potamilus streckersoni]|uniref:Uncharacterized protein n=1 Tax=Potamilus streckersoni TaxID=2493646 RepID=A0AAE0RNT4_9BIVA|nr:hypothetical protein CHS0354_011228 [Potamilus streckersoni]
MTLSIPEHYKGISLRLNGVLHTIGLVEDIRWKRINMWIQTEEIDSVGHGSPKHYFGSQAEATTTPGLHSDIDYILCSNLEENMFECKMYGHVQGQLLAILSHLLRQEGRYLVGISCDNIGQKFMMTCHYPLMELELQRQDLAEALAPSSLFLLKSISIVVQKFLGIDSLFDHNVFDRAFSYMGPRRKANAILMTFHYSIIGSKLASKIISQEYIDQRYLDIPHELLLRGSSSDVASGKLKLAAFYLVQDNLDLSEDVLNEIYENYRCKISNLPTISQDTMEIVLSENLSTTQFVSR